MNFRHKMDVGLFILRESVRSFIRHRGVEKAAVLAYNSFFALFAVFLLVLFVVGQIMASSEAAMGAVERMAAQLFPLGSDSIMREVRGLAEQRLWGLLSLPILFWTVTPLAAAIRGAFDQAYGHDRDLPFFKERLMDVLAVSMMLLLLVALVITEIVYAIVLSVLAGRLSFLVRMADMVIPLLVTVGLLTFLHYAFTPGKTRIAGVLAGSVVSALFLTLIGPIMTAIMQFNPNFGVAFGSLKAVFILLLWVHYSYMAILIGVELSANFVHRDALMVRELFETPDILRQNIERLGKMVKTYEGGDVVFREGDEGSNMFFVVQGEVEMTRGGQVLRVMKAGEYFGEMAMLLKASRAATATVKGGAARIVTIPAANIEAVLAQNPKIALTVLREMADRLRKTDILLKD